MELAYKNPTIMLSKDCCKMKFLVVITKYAVADDIL